MTARTTTDDIGMTLRLERVRARVFLSDVAGAIGISIGHLSNIERGKRSVDPEMVERIRAVVRALAR